MRQTTRQTDLIMNPLSGVLVVFNTIFVINTTGDKHCTCTSSVACLRVPQINNKQNKTATHAHSQIKHGSLILLLDTKNPIYWITKQNKISPWFSLISQWVHCGNTMDTRNINCMILSDSGKHLITVTCQLFDLCDVIVYVMEVGLCICGMVVA